MLSGSTGLLLLNLNHASIWEHKIQIILTTVAALLLFVFEKSAEDVSFCNDKPNTGAESEQTKSFCFPQFQNSLQLLMQTLLAVFFRKIEVFIRVI